MSTQYGASRPVRHQRVAGSRWRFTRRGLAVLVTAGLLTAPATAAWAGQEGGGTSGNGYSVSVRVSYSGDARPSSGGSVSVKAACWWTPAGGQYDDAVAMLKWYDETTNSGESPGITALYGGRANWVKAAKEAKSGTPMSWYIASCTNSADLAKLNLGSTSVPDPVNGPTQVYIVYRAYPSAQGVPAPLVDPADLARAGRDRMVIPEPATDRNPRIDAAGAPTLVDLPTWFWVRNPAAVGGAAGTRTIRAQIVGSNIWAQVVAKTGGLLISSPVGSTDCTPAQARTAYAKGAKAGGACTVTFTQASVHDQDGWPVVVATDWTATWTGSGNTGGTLDGLHREDDINVPVAEVQNVVTR